MVVVRIVNHDERHSFLAKATLLDQQGATITSISTPVTLAAKDGHLVRFTAKNPQDRPVWSVQFDALPR